jgi:hypothetical protein
MVFGNLDDHSGTGVVFSANPSTGQEGMFGEWLPRAQGEDIVSGSHTPNRSAHSRPKCRRSTPSWKGYVEMLSNHIGGVVDVEFTVEAGKLYVLQVRKPRFRRLRPPRWRCVPSGPSRSPGGGGRQPERGADPSAQIRFVLAR